jgi:cytochrome c biogenesis factor
MIVKVLAPEFRLFIIVIKNANTRALEALRNGKDMGPLLACER